MLRRVALKPSLAFLLIAAEGGVAFAQARVAVSSADAPVIPQAGTFAPDFSLRSQSGRTINLRSLRGHWVVLYFYPEDFTAGCTIEAHGFERDAATYAKLNAVILGVQR